MTRPTAESLRRRLVGGGYTGINGRAARELAKEAIEALAQLEREENAIRARVDSAEKRIDGARVHAEQAKRYAYEAADHYTYNAMVALLTALTIDPAGIGLCSGLNDEHMACLRDQGHGGECLFGKPAVGLAGRLEPYCSGDGRCGSTACAHGTNAKSCNLCGGSPCSCIYG